MYPLFTSEQDQWRREVRAFLDEQLPKNFDEDPEFNEEEAFWELAREFSAEVGRRGWIGLTWPKSYGGLERPVADRLIMAEEFAYRSAPLINSIGWGLAAGSLLFGGTEDQRRRFLPPIAQMETFWVEGLSEPGAGSDLASLTTRADRDGDDWVINGQKTFTTWGSHGDVMFVAARTDQTVAKHRGVSIFCVDLRLPGVSMTPLYNIGGGRQNHTYLDNVRVKGDMLIGEEGRGWELIMHAFYGAAGINAKYATWQRRLDDLIQYCKLTTRRGQRLSENPMIRDKLAELALQVEAERLLAYSNLGRLDTEVTPPFAGALDVVVVKENLSKFAELYNEVLSAVGQLARGSRWAPIDGMPESWYRWSFRSHAGGTPQVKRMVLATRGLGLPR